jgi:hypothetical protein
VGPNRNGEGLLGIFRGIGGGEKARTYLSVDSLPAQRLSGTHNQINNTPYMILPARRFLTQLFESGEDEANSKFQIRKLRAQNR